MKTISLTQLLSSCIDANRQGCQIIQDYQQAQQLQHPPNGRDSNDPTNKPQQHHQHQQQQVWKEAGNPKSVVTQADIDAQACIIAGLRATWGDDLLIIGEEDEADEDDGDDNDNDGEMEAASTTTSTTLLLDGDNCGTIIDDEQLNLDDLTVFVDPLDGTREFVEGRLENVACLIGIAKNGRSIAGVIGLPFPDGSTQSNVEVHYAVADQEGSFNIWSGQDASPSSSFSSRAKTLEPVAGVTLLTGDSKDPVLVNGINCVKSIIGSNHHLHHRQLIVGGTAAKLRLVTTTANSIAVLHFKTELWDTCAAEALLVSNGGKISDLFGSPLVHSPERPFGNIFGVVASSGGETMNKIHDELCRTMRADRKAVHQVFHKWMGDKMYDPDTPQAVDIARDLDGLPYGLNDLEQLVAEENPHCLSLEAYSVPEADAWRGMMSNGVRFRLKWSTDDTVSTDSEVHPPLDIFVKRVVMSDLAHARDKLKTAPHKLVRDVRSYQVETAFLTSEACQSLIKDAKLNLNKVLGSDLRPITSDIPKDQLESKFSICLEYMQQSDGWTQQWLLDEEATKSALGALAKIHAYFWKGSKFWQKDGGRLGRDLENIVWPNGGYMGPRLQGTDQFSKVNSGYLARLDTFKNALEKLPELDGADIASIGERLEGVATRVGALAHPFASFEGAESIGKGRLEKYRTLIHGDPKQANFFFRRNQESGDLDVGIIDFQWCGFGLAATDVAHYLSAAVMPDCLSLDGKKESALLDHYYDCLSKAMVEFEVASNLDEVRTSVFAREVLQEQYEVALLDVCRMVFAYAWRRYKMESSPTPESLNRNSYNKSFGSVLWLVTRCHLILESMKTLDTSKAI